MTDDISKIKNSQASGSSIEKYKRLFYGDVSFVYFLAAETVFFLFSGIGGALGLLLRRLFYTHIFAQCGRNVSIGKNVIFRHPLKIRLGDNVIIDDNCLIDAKGTTNSGITIEDGVYIGRNSSVYCKNGNIELHQNVNISSSCTIFSSNDLSVESDTMIGAYTYILSGGSYEFDKDTAPFTMQSGMKSIGPLTVGKNCWLGARVTVLDAASVGNGCVVGAGAVVTKPLPDNVLATGVPARIARNIPPRKTES